MVLGLASAAPKPRRTLRRAGPLLSLGVPLLLAAGVTVLSVTGDNLPVSVLAANMALLTSVALASAIPPGCHKLTATAEHLPSSAAAS